MTPVLLLLLLLPGAPEPLLHHGSRRGAASGQPGHRRLMCRCVLGLMGGLMSRPGLPLAVLVTSTLLGHGAAGAGRRGTVAWLCPVAAALVAAGDVPVLPPLQRGLVLVMVVVLVAYLSSRHHRWHLPAPHLGFGTDGVGGTRARQVE